MRAKYLVDSGCDLVVKAVYIPGKGRSTPCMSSQASRKMHCSFCITGRQIYDGNRMSASTGKLGGQRKIPRLKYQHYRNKLLTFK